MTEFLLIPSVHYLSIFPPFFLILVGCCGVSLPVTLFFFFSFWSFFLLTSASSSITHTNTHTHTHTNTHTQTHTHTHTHKSHNNIRGAFLFVFYCVFLHFSPYPHFVEIQQLRLFFFIFCLLFGCFFQKKKNNNRGILTTSNDKSRSACGAASHFVCA